MTYELKNFQHNSQMTEGIIQKLYYILRLCGYRRTVINVEKSLLN